MIQPLPTKPAVALAGRLSSAGTRSGLFRLSVARFLAALVLLFVSAPFVDQFKHGLVVEAALMTLVLGMGVLAVGARRKTLRWAIILVLPAVLGNWAHHFWPERWHMEAVTAARLVFVGFVVVRLLVFILRAPRVNSEVLCAGISIYLLLGLLWTFAYTAVARVTPDAFAFSVPASASHEMAGFNAFYFSFTTLTTLGYGDITPISNVARMLAIMESMSGTLFVGVLIARLVSLYSTSGPAQPENGPRNGPAPPATPAAPATATTEIE
jgi:hypothetical protein